MRARWRQRRGMERELQYSRSAHVGHCAVLISSRVLRARGLGQVDICFIRRRSLVVVEVKGHYGPGGPQRRRLQRACQWLGELFQREVIFHTDYCEKEFLP